MRIFIFTTCFAPSIGGIERLTELLATQFTGLGHDVALATPTPGPDRGPWPLLSRPSALFAALLVVAQLVRRPPPGQLEPEIPFRAGCL